MKIIVVVKGNVVKDSLTTIVAVIEDFLTTMVVVVIEDSLTIVVAVVIEQVKVIQK